MTKMNSEYLQLAKKRVTTNFKSYLHPEDFNYDFKEWVSPYTKSAHTPGNIAIVLQDWASADGLSGKFEPAIQKHGRMPSLLTNKRLDEMLRRVFSLDISDVYATNAFPFIKPGGMSSGIPIRHIVNTVKEFTAPELKIAKPRIVLALGSLTHKALNRAGIDAIHLPHPAARGMSLDDHEDRWRQAISSI